MPNYSRRSWPKRVTLQDSKGTDLINQQTVSGIEPVALFNRATNYVNAGLGLFTQIVMKVLLALLLLSFLLSFLLPL